MENNIINELNVIVNNHWAAIKNGHFFTLLKEKKIDENLYSRLMIQIYHYVSHNARSQAVAAFNLPSHASGLQSFLYRHAIEELGHEKMVLRDLESVNLLDPLQLEQPPLPPTNALIEYLYSIAIRYGAIARLGYSYWSESAYPYINDDLVGTIRRDLGLKDENLTFFITHSRIDEKHSAQVEAAIRKYCVEQENKILIKTVASTTLYLTGVILDAVAQNYLESI